MQAPINDNLVGTTLDQRYQVLEKLGTGKDGAIYRAEDLQRKYSVALRFLSVERVSDKALTQLRKSADAAAALAHPNIVRIYALNSPEGQKPYFVVDCVQGGQNLDHVLANQGKLSEATAINTFAQICDALDHAHGKGVVHRNLKPSNIMLIDAGEASYMVKIADFGVGRPSELAESRSKHKHQLSNVNYMSPEECDGKPLDHRSDIYSTGCLLYHCLTGQPPFTAASAFDVMTKQMNDALPSIGNRPGLRLAPQLQAIIERATAKSPEKRYQTALEMSHDLHLLREVTPEEWNNRAFAMKAPTEVQKMEESAGSSAPRIDFVKPLMILLGVVGVAAIPVAGFVVASVCDVEMPQMTKYKLAVQERLLPPNDPRVVKNLKVMMDYYKSHVQYADAYACKEKLDRASGVTSDLTKTE